MNSPAYIVLMPDNTVCWRDSWGDAVELQQEGGVIYEQAPRGPTPMCDLLRASIKAGEALKEKQHDPI